ncbi:RNA-binding protein (RRM superfamily) [Ceraceosorus bombacis]|uniref:Multiple RNA-binding domain-containing protein 1 n=1 Tax=Ceraceosorus bombacis TaxID=401625 RepID=A0A0P1BND1_9BASI|nr:RNA-binding protein (RRM superfamily) [Ceraceosorus bombacis]
MVPLEQDTSANFHGCISSIHHLLTFGRGAAKASAFPRMSRLIIKNLPSYLSEARLKDHFSTRGNVTDVKLVRKSDGTSRRFGFIGFKDEQAAQDAKEYFDRTFIDTARITVDFAREVGDSQLAESKAKRAQNGVPSVHEVGDSDVSRPHKKRALSNGKGASITKSEARGKDQGISFDQFMAKRALSNGKGASVTKSEARGKDQGISFDQFMAVMAPKNKRKAWQNEEEMAHHDDDAAAVAAEEKAFADSIAAKEERKRVKKERTARKAAETNSKGTEPVRSVYPTEEADDAPIKADAALDDEGLTDLDYMHRRMRRKIGGDDEEERVKKERTARKAAETNLKGTEPVRSAYPTEEADDAPPIKAAAALDDEGLTDLDYMHRRMRRKIGGDDEEEVTNATAKPKEFDQSDSEDGDSVSDAESIIHEEEAARAEKQRQELAVKAQQEQETTDTIMESRRLFVRNLPFTASETELEEFFGQWGAVQQTELEEFFGQWGAVQQAHIPLDKTTKTSKGVAFVRFVDPSNALSAFRESNGTIFQGRLLHLLPAVEMRKELETDSAAKSKSLKTQRKDQRKDDSGKGFNWGMLYMSADAVASSVAQRLGIEKAQIVGADGDADGGSKGLGPAVKLALAETRVIQETKAFLEREGIDVEAFEARNGVRPQRSETIILVKNIPYGTSAAALRELFEKHGEIGRVLMPPAGTMAIVEMVLPGEARVAFKALAYKRMGNSILYLEKAPVGLLRKDEEAAKTAPPSVPAPPTKEAQMLGLGNGSGNEALSEPGATLFIKNLSFATTDTGLAKAFQSHRDFAFARIQTRPNPRAGNDPGASARLSMGFGFVGFKNVDAAKSALKALDGKDLDGHTLSIAFAKRGQDEDGPSNTSSATSQTSTTKLMIKNLPFEATKTDVRQLFAAHGQLKSVRVPRKAATGSSSAGGARGFGFVEFTTRREAEAAMSALKHTHLLGRHLVIAWDKEDAQGVEGVRKRTVRALGETAGEESVARKRKLKLTEEDIAEAAQKELEEKDEDDD